MEYKIEYAPGRALIYFKKSPKKVRAKLKQMGARYVLSGNYWLLRKDIDKAVEYLEKYEENSLKSKKRMEECHFDSKPQLCEKCGKAAGTMGWCNWSKYLRPVEGWTAIVSGTKYPSGGNSYCITACPEYVWDGFSDREAGQFMEQERKDA